MPSHHPGLRRRTLWICAIVVIVPTMIAAHQPESVVTDRAFAFFVGLPAGMSAPRSDRSGRHRSASPIGMPREHAFPAMGLFSRTRRTREARGIDRNPPVSRTEQDCRRHDHRCTQAFVGLHARSILLISRRAMRLVSAEELQALVAHEMGHDYFWSDYQQARERRDLLALREVELKCDGIAGLTLVALGLAPTALMSAERKVRRFNETIDAVANADAYPSSSERERFIRAVIVLRAQLRPHP